MQPFANRADAGRQLAGLLTDYAGHRDAIVLGLARGGVPVGYEVAVTLGLALDVFVVRKLGVPGREQFALGAIASGGARVLNQWVVSELKISPAAIAAVAAKEQLELERRERVYRAGRTRMGLQGKLAILVDDGLATGASMRAAALALRQQRVREIVAAVPVAAPQTCAAFERHVERIVCARTPRRFGAVGMWYADFAQVSDAEVRELIRGRVGHVRSAP